MTTAVMANAAHDRDFEESRRNCKLLTSEEEAFDMLSKIEEAALDYETTSFSPAEGRVRLTQLCNDDYHFIIDHDFLGPIEKFLPAMQGKKFYVYNAKFETRWSDYFAKHENTNILDVDFMMKAVLGGRPTSLSIVCLQTLGYSLDKDEQASDWSSPMLTESQYDYAGFDAYVTWQIAKHWKGRMNDGHWNGFHVLNDAVRATTEAERTGLILDAVYHSKLVRLWERKQATYERYMRRFTPPSVIANFNSTKQLAEFFTRELDDNTIKAWPRTEKTNAMQMENAFLKSLGKRLDYPFNRWVAALVGYRYYGKYLSTYGEKLITKQNLTGRITSRFNIAQAQTGRYSSSSDNLQNIPRKPVVRRSFYSPPKGTDVMLLADYKGIEVRVLAELADDKQLRHDAIYGDVHSASASLIYNQPLEEIEEILKDKKSRYYLVTKEKRSKAKGFTFQLTYGAGPGALAEVLHSSIEDAIKAVSKWAERYPRAYHYRQKMFDAMTDTGFLPVCDGRTIYVRKAERTMPVAANYPIQGAAASVMYRAMYHVRNNFVAGDLDCVIAATVHDELLSYAHRDCAEEGMAAQIAGMERGWLDIFPGTTTDNLLEWVIGTSWADKP